MNLIISRAVFFSAIGLLFLWSCHTEVGPENSQHDTFFKKYGELGTEGNNALFYTDDGGYLLIGYAVEGSSISLIITKVDAYGSRLSHIVKPIGRYFYPLAKRLLNGNFIVNSLYSSDHIIISQEGTILSHGTFSSLGRRYSKPFEDTDASFYTSFSSGLYGFNSYNRIAWLDQKGDWISEMEFSNTLFNGKLATFYLQHSYRDSGEQYFMVTGSYYFTNPFSWSNPTKIYFAKISSRGEVLKLNILDSSDNSESNNVVDYLTTPQGDFVTLIKGWDDFTHFELIKTDLETKVIWRKKIRLTGQIHFAPNRLQPTSDGGFIISGYLYGKTKTYYAPFYVTVSKTGEVMQEKIYDFEVAATFRDGQEHPKGGYLFTGGIEDLGKGKEHTDAFFIRTDKNGNYRK